MRWMKPPPEDLPPTPNAFVVPLSQVGDYLPPGHPTVAPAERAATLEARHRAYNRRTNPAGLNLGHGSDSTCQPSCDAAHGIGNAQLPPPLIPLLQLYLMLS